MRRAGHADEVAPAILFLAWMTLRSSPARSWWSTAASPRPEQPSRATRRRTCLERRTP
ncbi:hypothetical protein LV779_36345 [Streptomyces thinghirensis]|nr:hypothetical protein [Streptomyces thinghirensis]